MGPTFPVYPTGHVKKLKTKKKRKELKAAVDAALKADPNFKKLLKKARQKTMPAYKKLLGSP